MMEQDIESVLYSEEQLKNRVKELGAVISKDYEGKEPLMIGVLKGSFVFMADLARCITTNCGVEFMAVSSYGNSTTTTGQVQITRDLSCNVEGKDILVIEDILDSGLTLAYLKNYLQARRPATISICTLLDKPARRKSDIVPDYVGFICPDEFIVGYGLDYAGRYRNLPYIGVLKREVYA